MCTWCSAPWDLHVELDGVHAQDGVSYMAEQVAGGNHPGKRRQLRQLLKLLFPSGQMIQTAGDWVLFFYQQTVK